MVNNQRKGEDLKLPQQLTDYQKRKDQMPLRILKEFQIILHKIHSIKYEGTKITQIFSWNNSNSLQHWIFQERVFRLYQRKLHHLGIRLIISLQELCYPKKSLMDRNYVNQINNESIQKYYIMITKQSIQQSIIIKTTQMIVEKNFKHIHTFQILVIIIITFFLYIHKLLKEVIFHLDQNSNNDITIIYIQI